MASRYLNKYVQAIVDIDAGETEITKKHELHFLEKHMERIERLGDATVFSDSEQRIIRHLTNEYLGPDRLTSLWGQKMLHRP